MEGGARGGLPGSRVRQNSAALVEQIADIPARRGLQGSPRPNRAAYSGAHSLAEDRLPRQNPTADVGQIADIPARRGLSDFIPGQGSSASSSSLHDEGIRGGFRTFPRTKKVRRSPASLSADQLGEVSSCTPAAYDESMALVEDESEPAVARFGGGLRPWRVCTRFLDFQLGRPVRGCAYGDRCTFAHSWAELHPEASAHEHGLASYFPE